MPNYSFKNGRCGDFDQKEQTEVLKDAQSLSGNVFGKKNIEILTQKSFQRSGRERTPQELKKLLQKFRRRGLV